MHAFFKTDQAGVLHQSLVLTDQVLGATIWTIETTSVELSTFERIPTTPLLTLVIQADVLPINEVVKPVGFDFVNVSIIFATAVIKLWLLLPGIEGRRIRIFVSTSGGPVATFLPSWNTFVP